jgi:hypothetical protein
LIVKNDTIRILIENTNYKKSLQNAGFSLIKSIFKIILKYQI